MESHPDRLPDVLALLVLAGVGITGLARAVQLAARGVWVLPIDHERGPVAALADLAFVLGLVYWVYRAIALGTSGPHEPTIPYIAVRWLGVAVAAAGLALYVKVLHDFGASWRFTIDRERPDELVTTGVFERTRNPVYLALLLVAFGAPLALGSLQLLLLACVAPIYLRQLVRREESFLAEHYGDRYSAYCASVPRWVDWPRSDER
jgi:protein-S-isoprenylcysteine O-methyltransferase Ste14